MASTRTGSLYRRRRTNDSAFRDSSSAQGMSSITTARGTFRRPRLGLSEDRRRPRTGGCSSRRGCRLRAVRRGRQMAQQLLDHPVGVILLEAVARTPAHPHPVRPGRQRTPGKRRLPNPRLALDHHHPRLASNRLSPALRQCRQLRSPSRKAPSHTAPSTASSAAASVAAEAAAPRDSASTPGHRLPPCRAVPPERTFSGAVGRLIVHQSR